VREKYCSLAEKVRLISQVNRAMLQVSLPTTQWTFSAANRQREPLQEYYRKFMHLRAHTPNITDEVVILTAVNSLCPSPCSSRLARKPTMTVAELHEVMEKYYRVDANFGMKSKA